LCDHGVLWRPLEMKELIIFASPRFKQLIVDIGGVYAIIETVNMGAI